MNGKSTRGKSRNALWSLQRFSIGRYIFLRISRSAISSFLVCFLALFFSVCSLTLHTGIILTDVECYIRLSKGLTELVIKLRDKRPLVHRTGEQQKKRESFLLFLHLLQLTPRRHPPLRCLLTFYIVVKTFSLRIQCTSPTLGLEPIKK